VRTVSTANTLMLASWCWRICSSFRDRLHPPASLATNYATAAKRRLRTFPRKKENLCYPQSKGQMIPSIMTTLEFLTFAIGAIVKHRVTKLALPLIKVRFLLVCVQAVGVCAQGQCYEHDLCVEHALLASFTPCAYVCAPLCCKGLYACVCARSS
jgi:hypothetical protein